MKSSDNIITKIFLRKLSEAVEPDEASPLANVDGAESPIDTGTPEVGADDPALAAAGADADALAASDKSVDAMVQASMSFEQSVDALRTTYSKLQQFRGQLEQIVQSAPTDIVAKPIESVRDKVDDAMKKLGDDMREAMEQLAKFTKPRGATEEIPGMGPAAPTAPTTPAAPGEPPIDGEPVA